MVCVDPDIGYTGARELEKSPSPFTSSLSEYSISKVSLVLVSIHESVIEYDVMVVGVFRVGGEGGVVVGGDVVVVGGDVVVVGGGVVVAIVVVANFIEDH